jgi:hypothetical protein
MTTQAVITQTLTCSVCKQDQLCQSIPAKPFSRVISKACACGYQVQVVATIDPEKFASSFPLPGYSREEIHEKYDNFRYVVGQSSGFTGGEYVPA